MRTVTLLLADILVFYIVLFLALSARAGGVVSWSFYVAHIDPFSYVLLVLLLILYLVGLYDSDFPRQARTTFNTLLRALVALAVVMVAFFYFVPSVGLTPKTNLVVFLTFLFVALFLLHFYISRLFHFARPQALLIGGPAHPSGFEIVSTVPPDSSPHVILGTIKGMSNGRVLMSFSDERLFPLLPQLHTLMLAGVVFIDIDSLLEEERGAVDLAFVNELWLLQHMHRVDRRLLLVSKRVLDIFLALLLVPLYVVLLPFVVCAIIFEDGWGSGIFIVQERLGIGRRPITLYKFRTMNRDDAGEWHRGDPAVVTRVGAFLRKSRIDELPQLWNVLKGDISLIGPRPDMVKLGRTLASEIPYYNARYIVRPGLTGWAQVTQEVVPQSVEESRERLAYDLYYIKHLSLFLELKIILKTTKLLLTKVFS